MRIWNAVSTHLCYSQAEAKVKTTGYQSAADHYIKMLGSLSKSHSLDLQLWTMTKKKKVYPKVVSCNQQKVVLDTVQQISDFLSTAQAAEEFHNLAQLTPSSYADGPYVCDVQLFTSLCSELAFFQQFFLCMSTDRACGQLYNSIMQMTTLIIKSVYQVTTEEQGSPPWPSRTLHHWGTI